MYPIIFEGKKPGKIEKLAGRIEGVFDSMRCQVSNGRLII